MPNKSHIPIIKLYETLIVTIQIELSDSVVMQLKDDVGEAIQKLGPRGLIIDVSGVEIIDSYISRAIRDIGLISRLMGVEAVISGLDPNIAITLIEMGMDLEGVQTYLHLEAAYEALNPSMKLARDADDDTAEALAHDQAWWSA
jgi:rsbT antagonist protein RsbS